eukprot:SAG11_NODE_21_length_25065_cov_3.589081_21_plen_94_part_00
MRRVFLTFEHHGSSTVHFIVGSHVPHQHIHIYSTPIAVTLVMTWLAPIWSYDILRDVADVTWSMPVENFVRRLDDTVLDIHQSYLAGVCTNVC